MGSMNEQINIQMTLVMLHIDQNRCKEVDDSMYYVVRQIHSKYENISVLREIPIESDVF